MQVAMRLGPYWWKRFWEKKICHKEIREYKKGIAIAVGVVIVALIMYTLIVIFLNKKGITPEQAKSSQTITIFVLFSGGAIIISSIFCVINLVCFSIAFTKALIATLRFRTIFGFSPPVTVEGHRAVELAIKKILAIRARDLDEIYERGKRTLKGIESYECDFASCYSDDALQKIGKNVASIEYYDLGDLEKAKKQAKKRFYSARDAARNPFLPFPFKNLPDSFKEYLNYLPKKEK